MKKLKSIFAILCVIPLCLSCGSGSGSGSGNESENIEEVDEEPTPEDVAVAFIKAYYIESDIKKAEAYCSGGFLQLLQMQETDYECNNLFATLKQAYPGIGTDVNVLTSEIEDNVAAVKVLVGGYVSTIVVLYYIDGQWEVSNLQ